MSNIKFLSNRTAFEPIGGRIDRLATLTVALVLVGIDTH